MDSEVNANVTTTTESFDSENQKILKWKADLCKKWKTEGPASYEKTTGKPVYAENSGSPIGDYYDIPFSTFTLEESCCSRILKDSSFIISSLQTQVLGWQNFAMHLQHQLSTEGRKVGVQTDVMCTPPDGDEIHCATVENAPSTSNWRQAPKTHPSRGTRNKITNNHHVTAVQSRANTDDSKLNSRKCKICGRVNTTVKSKYNHQLTHGNYFCPFCNVKLSRPDTRKRHMNTCRRRP